MATNPPPNEALEEYPKPGDALRTASAPVSGESQRRLNVVVIMTDTLRPDHIAAVGNTADAPREWEHRKNGQPGEAHARRERGEAEPWIDTREMDRFARDATIFPRAYAGSFPTVPCRTDCYTGRTVFPMRGWSPLPLDGPCLAATLLREGYRTQLIYDPPMLQRSGFGFDRGFQGVRWIRGQTSDGFVVDPTLDVKLNGPPEKWRGKGTAWLQHQRNSHYWASELDHFGPRTLFTGEQWLEKNYQQGPFFLWIDTWDPHEPWDAPQYYVDKYDPGYDGLVVNQPEYSPGDCLTTEEWRHVRALYAAEVTMVDRALGRFYAKLDDLGLRENTLVIHLSDHGHFLGEHGIQGKPTSGPLQIYEELGRITLLVRHPDARGAGQRSAALAQPVDIFATVLDAAGVPENAPLRQGMDGRSLIPLLDGGGDAASSHRRAAYTSRHPFLQRRPTPVTITTQDYAYIYWPGDSGTRSELYHLPSDPRQTRNLLGQHRQLAEELHTEYLAWVRARNPEMADWIEQVERDPAWQPDATKAWKGMV
ncbi:MAG TPA: sulfatase [Chloroflexota bacterium]|nr:sulfatase [Chloroflexota bacterium]